MQDKAIRILTRESEPSSKSALPSMVSGVATRTIELTNETLGERLKEFFTTFEVVLERIPDSSAGYSIDEIEVCLGIDAKGGIELLGKVEVGMSTGLKFTLKRQHQ